MILVYYLPARKIHYTNHESFDKGNFDVSWFVNFTSSTIHVKVKAATAGWVGFGFALRAPTSMKNYDVAVGGVWPNGSVYLKVGNSSACMLFTRRLSV